MPALFPYQRIGAEWLAERSAAMLADSPGIGKTAQAIAACDAAGVRTAVVVCPGIARENWRREWLVWQTTQRVVEVMRSTNDLFTARAMFADVLIISYALLAQEKVRKTLATFTIDALICDEAHALKEPKSVRSKAIYGSRFDRKTGLASRAKRVWLLTGTPLMNHPGELWTHIRTLWPESLAGVCGLRRNDFLEHFCVVEDFTGKIVGARRVPQLLDLLKPHVLRRLQSEVQADLPPLRWAHVTVSPETLPPMPPELVEVATVVQSAIATAKGDDEAVAALAAEQMHLATLRRWTGVAKAAAVAALIRDEVAEGAGPFVIFAIHREVMATLAAAIPGALTLSGDTRMAERQAIIDSFQAGHIPALVCQLSIAATALTLTRSRNVVFAESSWVPADMQQAAKRCHRIGQTDSVLARVVSLAGSIDETIGDVLIRKTATIAKLELAKSS